MCDGSNEADFHRALESALAALRRGILEARAAELGALERGFAARLRVDSDQAHPRGAESALAARNSGNSDAAPQKGLAVRCSSSSCQASEHEAAACRTTSSNSFDAGRLSGRGAAVPPEHAAFPRSISSSTSNSSLPAGESPSRRGTLSSRFAARGLSSRKLSGVMSKLKTQGQQTEEKGEVYEMLRLCQNPSVLMQAFIALAIVVNAITIGLSTDIHPESPAWLVVDAIFAFIFLSEMLIKMRPGCREYFRGEDGRWNAFEFLLVVLAVSELVMASLRDSGGDTTTMLSVFRMVRLARIFRIARLARLQIFKDLFIMFTAASGGVKTLLWAILLIALPIYILALVLTEILGRHADAGNGAECFANLRTSFFTVFRCIVAGDCSDLDGRPIFYLVMLEYGWIYSGIYYISIMVMCFGFFNVITAVFIDNIMTSAKFSDVQKKHQRLLDTDMFNQLAGDLVDFIWSMYKAVEGIDADLGIDHATDLNISPPFFDMLMTKDGFKDILSSLDISYEDQLDLFETLDVDGNGVLDMTELVVGISKLRGDARRTDVVGISLVVRAIQAEVTQLRKLIEGSALARRKSDDAPHAPKKTKTVGRLSGDVAI